MLRLLVPLMPGETTTSFCARLAIRNACRNVREFCQLLGLTFQRIVDGDPKALTHLADLTGVDTDTMAASTIRRLDHVRFSINGETVTKAMLRRVSVRACPFCLSDDIAANPHLGHLAAFQRIEWQLSSFRRCDIHGTALVDIAIKEGSSRSHDFGLSVLSQLNSLPKWSATAYDLPPSRFESYIRCRIRGEKHPPVWLDRFRLYAVARLCDTLGVLSRFGPKVRRLAVSEAEIHAACDEGFSALENGPASLSPVLDRLLQPFWSRAATTGPQALFGEFDQWLTRETDPEYDAVRDFVREQVLTRLPFGPGDTIMGAAVESRRLWSVHTAAQATGQHRQRLRKLLAASGFIPANTKDMSDDRIVFPATTEADDFLAKIKDAVSLNVAMKQIGASRDQMRSIIDDGMLIPLIRGSSCGNIHSHAFVNNDLDTLLTAIISNATHGDLSDLDGITLAGKKSFTSTGFIIRLLVERKLTRVGIDTTKCGLRSVLVDPEEVRSHVPVNPDKPLTLRQTMKISHWSDYVVKALVKNGYLKATIRGSHVRIDQRELEAFQREFVSLLTLANERGCHFARLKKILSDIGVRPAFDRDVIAATFYRRRDIDKAIGHQS